MPSVEVKMSDLPPQARPGAKQPKSKKTWHYTPSLPLRVSPYFRWPPDAVAVLKWIFRGWFPVSERLIVLLLSILSWVYFHPALERCREFALDWMAQIYLRNLALMIIVAGGLHLYFYTWRRQGDERRYDARPFPTNTRVFTFRSQLRDNIFWSCASGVTRQWCDYLERLRGIDDVGNGKRLCSDASFTGRSAVADSFYIAAAGLGNILFFPDPSPDPLAAAVP